MCVLMIEAGPRIPLCTAMDNLVMLLFIKVSFSILLLTNELICIYHRVAIRPGLTLTHIACSKEQ